LRDVLRAVGPLLVGCRRFRAAICERSEYTTRRASRRGLLSGFLRLRPVSREMVVSGARFDLLGGEIRG